jgi:hypothetical protein
MNVDFTTFVRTPSAIATRSAEQIKVMSASQLMEVVQVNAFRVVDLIKQPALSFKR